MSIRASASWYYNTLGFRGILGISAYRLFGHPREITVYPPTSRNPIYLRLRTTDASTFGEILLHGEYDFDLPFSPKTIIDAGANIGMASIYFANRYPDAKVIAIEAEASNFAVLARNVRPYPSITPIHAALWNRDGEISINAPDPKSGAWGNWGFFASEGPGRPVRAITMQTLMKEMQLDSIDLLKVDIEGAEKEVFEACDWIDKVRCLMIELHDRFKPGCSEAVSSVAQGFSKSHKSDTTVFLRAS